MMPPNEMAIAYQRINDFFLRIELILLLAGADRLRFERIWPWHIVTAGMLELEQVRN